MADTGRRRIPYLKITSLIAAFLILVILAAVFSRDETEVVSTRQNHGYRILTDLQSEEVEDSKTPIGMRTDYHYILDSALQTDQSLVFYTVHQYVRVYLDGELIYSLMPAGKARISRTVGSNWTRIPLYREDAGRELTIEIIPVYEGVRERKVDFMIGSWQSVYSAQLRKDLPQLMMGFLAASIGIIFIAGATYCLLKKKEGKHLAYLGLFSLMLGIWRLADTRFTAMLIPVKPVFIFYLSITMLCLGMLPLMQWMEFYFTKKIKRMFRIYCLLVSLTCAAECILQFLGVWDLRQMLTVIHITLGIGIGLIIAAILYETICYPDRKAWLTNSILPFICVLGGIGDIILYYVRGTSSGLAFSLWLFLSYLVISGITTIMQYSNQKLAFAQNEKELAEKARKMAEGERKLAEQNRLLASKERSIAEYERVVAEKDRIIALQERDLTRKRIATMMSQIRSHFIFNVLTTISSYCKTDPQKADRALIRFSRYLRKNIKMIEEEGLIPFTSELEQVEDYVSLEQMRFENQIHFVKDIQVTDFKLPPLTVQPMVENAIKHGLTKAGRSGTVRLSTFQMEQAVGVRIEDDGAGFAVEDIDSEKSVGIRNVKTRLEAMMGGNVEIQSHIGEGTQVTLILPQRTG